MRAFALLRTLLYMSGFVLLWGWAAVLVRRYDAAIGVALPEWLAPIGWLAMASGGVVVLACGSNLALRGGGTPAPFDPTVAVVAGGPYRFVRNPMYLGAAALLAGYGLSARSTAVLLLAAGGTLLAHAFVVLVEEPGLERRFGASYCAYKRVVNRWLPRIPRARSAEAQEAPPAREA